MGVPVFIAIVFALAGIGVFAANKVHAKRIGAEDVPFLLEAYREIDAMGLNGPRMTPEMPHGDQRNGYLTPEQGLTLAGHHSLEPAPRTLSFDTKEMEFRYRDGKRIRLRVPREVAEDPSAIGHLFDEARQWGSDGSASISEYLRAQTNGAPVAVLARLAASATDAAVFPDDNLPMDAWLRDLAIKRERGWS